MIISLPDREIQAAEAERKRLEPRNRFQFLWDAFFKTRKFKLTADEVGELEAIDKGLRKWATACGRLYAVRQDPQAAFDTAATHYLNEPTDDNFYRLLSHNFSQPFFQNLIGRAIEQFENYLAGERARLFPPIVRKHLSRIHDSLCAEYVAQEQVDRKALERLSGVASGGESAACIEIRNQAERIKGLLEGGDLTDWRGALGPFLP